MRPFRIVEGAPLAADVVEVPLGYDHKFIETLMFQALNETLNVCPQVGREGRVSLDLRPADRDVLHEAISKAHSDGIDVLSVHQ